MYMRLCDNLLYLRSTFTWAHTKSNVISTITFAAFIQEIYIYIFSYLSMRMHVYWSFLTWMNNIWGEKNATTPPPPKNNNSNPQDNRIHLKWNAIFSVRFLLLFNVNNCMSSIISFQYKNFCNKSLSHARI